MARTCPRGVFCIENTTLAFLFVIIVASLAVFYVKFGNNKKNIVFNMFKSNESENNPFFNLMPRMSSAFSMAPNNILMNPHLPPLKNNHYFPSDSGDVRGIPINIKTNSMDVAYSQVGILTRDDAKETILPLMGRPLQTNRQKWQYYTMGSKHNNIKLPISKGGQNCTGEYGCDELYNGDTVYVEGYKDAFKVVIYETNGPRYIPL